MPIIKNFFLILIFFCFSNVSYAAVFKCINSDGGVKFQDIPCQIGDKEKALATDHDNRGFLKKWFQAPLGSPQAICIDRNCQCGDEQIKLPYHTTENMVSSMVDNLISAWNSYNELNANMSNKVQKSSGCIIRIYQKAFNASYNKFLDENKKILKGEATSEDSRKICQSKLDEERESNIKISMSPPYNQSRRLAEINNPAMTHLGNPCDNQYQKKIANLPRSYDVGGYQVENVNLNLNRLK